MCSIFGWFGNVSLKEKLYILKNANERGRDGHGFWYDGFEYRGISKVPTDKKLAILGANKVLANYRATPTTELETKVSYLQPYSGIVHNGVIANDKDLGSVEIDSMVLPIIFKDRSFASVIDNLSLIKGSYAIAYFSDEGLVLACNYKPIYYCLTREGGCLFASTPDMLPLRSYKVKPYSALLITDYLTTKEAVIPLKQNKRVLVSASAGLDSTTVAYMLKHLNYEVTLVNFRYGCLAETKELQMIERIREHGSFDLKIIQMPDVMSGTITEGKFHEKAIEGTEYAMDWVSGRNLLMLSILTSYAEAKGYSYISFGGNLEEGGAYPDNEQEFGRMFNNILPYATQNGTKITLLQPLATLMKHEIVAEGLKLGVPFKLTWSCYQGKDKHCGVCAPCYMRRVAFERNGLKDPVFE